jgi:hypothetical protein
MPVNLETVLQYFDIPLAMSLGTRDSNLKPDYSRVVGTALSESATTISNLDDNGFIALTMVHPLNYRCLQIKGRCIRHYEADSSEMVNVNNYLDLFGSVIEKMGLPENVVYNWPHDPAIVVEMELDEVYEQTPKKGAGEKLKES